MFFYTATNIMKLFKGNIIGDNKLFFFLLQISLVKTAIRIRKINTESARLCIFQIGIWSHFVTGNFAILFCNTVPIPKNHLSHHCWIN